MNPETFIVNQVMAGISGSSQNITDIRTETIKRYRRGIFESVPYLIQEMRGEFSLAQGTTVKEFMKATGMSEYRARQYLKNLLCGHRITVDREHRPYVYKV